MSPSGSVSTAAGGPRQFPPEPLRRDLRRRALRGLRREDGLEDPGGGALGGGGGARPAAPLNNTTHV